jgi:hypothetical protein
MSYSSSSDDIEGEVVDAPFSLVDQAIAMLKAEMKASSSRWSRLH